MPTKEELQKIIDQFDKEELKRLGIFGIFHYNSDSDESFIKANKEGLELFALELLKAARDTDEILADKEKDYINLDYEGDWRAPSSDVIIHAVEPIIDKQEIKLPEEHIPTFVDKLVPYGCGLIFIIILIAIVIGFGTVIGWLF